MASNKFIGSGYIFPIIIGPQGRPEPVEDLRLIESSIKNILSWPKNVRFFRENFGSRIEELLEEPNDSVAKSLLNTFIKEAIKDNEKRVIIKTVRIIYADYIKVNIELRCYVRVTNSEETFIFPFYKELN